MPAVDAMLVLNTTETREVKRVFRDGSSVHIASDTGTPVYDQAPEFGGVVQHNPAYTQSYQLDQRTWVPDFSKVFTSEIGTAVDTVISGGGGLFLRNRSGVVKYYQRSGQGYKRYDSATGSLESTVTVFPSGSSPVRSLQWLENQTVVFVRNDGSLRVYDLSNDTTILTSAIDAPTRVAVDHKNKLIVAIRASDRTTQVYKLEVQPASVSAISPSPGTYLRYQREDISVTVLGSNSEPAANVPVEWTLTLSPSGTALGKVSPYISLTDANGVARAVYCPPGNDWTMGVQEILTAKVYT